MTAPSTLERKALLVKLSLHQWGNYKADRVLAKEVAISKGALDTDDEYKKRLVPTAALKPLRQSLQAVRTEHEQRTRPWLLDGTGILPSADYFTYSEAITLRRNIIDQRLDEFCTHYPVLVQKARERRGKLFDEADYPTVEALRAAFHVSVDFLPFPSTQDVRLEGDDEEVIAEKIRESIRNQTDLVASKLHDDLIESVKSYYDRISDVDKVFHETAITRLEDRLIIAKKLDMPNAKLAALVERIEKSELAAVDANRLRLNRETREEMVRRAWVLLNPQAEKLQVVDV